MPSAAATTVGVAPGTSPSGDTRPAIEPIPKTTYWQQGRSGGEGSGGEGRGGELVGMEETNWKYLINSLDSKTKSK